MRGAREFTYRGAGKLHTEIPCDPEDTYWATLTTLVCRPHAEANYHPHQNYYRLILFRCRSAKPNQRKADSQAGSRKRGVCLNTELFYPGKTRRIHQIPPNSRIALVSLNSSLFFQDNKAPYSDRHPFLANRLANRLHLVWFAGTTPN